MASVFFSYSHADEAWRDQLETHLAMLKRQGIIETWHDRKILAGGALEDAIDQHVENDDIVLLLVSPDFLNSDYCYTREMTRALERHAKGEAVVIPIILRSCDWLHSPLKDLRATPMDGRPINKWPDHDEALLQVANDVRAAASRLGLRPVDTTAQTFLPASVPVASVADHAALPRSSNLAIRKDFSQRDKDLFLDEGFDYMANFFEASLQELEKRNVDIQTDFKRISATRFYATIYRAGAVVSEYTVFSGGVIGKGIHLSHGRTESSNSFNGSLSVETDDQRLYWNPQMIDFGNNRETKLSHEGASERFWALMMAPLQQRRW